MEEMESYDLEEKVKIRQTGVICRTVMPEQDWWIDPYDPRGVPLWERKQILDAHGDIVWRNVTGRVTGFKVFATYSSSTPIADQPLKHEVSVVNGDMTFTAPVEGWYKKGYMHPVSIVFDLKGTVMIGPADHINQYLVKDYEPVMDIFSS